MKTRNGRLVEARFADVSFSMIRACFKNYEKDGAFYVEMYSYDPENP